MTQSDAIASKRQSPARWVSSAFLIIAAALTGLIAAFFPLVNDDILFAGDFGCPQHTICPGTKIDIFRTLADHHTLVNGRFGDMFGSLFILLPRPAYGLLYGLLFGLLLLMMAKVAGISFRSHPMKMIWLTGAALLFFPWSDYLYIRALFLNYFPSALFGLGAVKYFISEKQTHGKTTAGLLMVAFFASCWHEEIPFVLLPSAIVYCCLTKRLTRNQIYVAAGMALGVAFLLSSPAFFKRTEQVVIITGMREILAYCYSSLNIAVSGAAIVLYYLTHKRAERNRRDTAAIWALALTVVPSAALMLMSHMDIRMCFFSMVFGITALVRSLRDTTLSPAKMKAAWGISVIAMILLVGQLALALRQTIQSKALVSEIISLATRHKDGPIYFDMDRFDTHPAWTLYKNYGRRFVTDSYTRTSLAEYCGRKDAYGIISPALRDFNIAEARTLDEANGVFFYKGCIIVRSQTDTEKYMRGLFRVTFADGSKQDIEFIGNYFSDPEGRRMIYLYPAKPVMPEKEVQAIEDLYDLFHWE